MGKAAKKATTKAKKFWVNIFAPKLFNEQPIGETPCYEKEEILGRKITTNMMALTRDMKKQSMNVEFEISDLKGENAFTKVVGYNISPPSVRRMMRRNRDKIEDSFSVVTKDNNKVRVKPVLITRFASSNSIRSSIRKENRKIITIYSKKLDFEALVNEVITGKLQKTMKEKLKKIYPINISEIRVLKLEGINDKEEVVDAPVSEKPQEVIAA